MKKIILAYASDGNFTGIPESDAKKLTHVNYSFAVIRDGSASVKHWKNGDLCREFMTNNPHITVCLSIGGWGADGFSQAVADEVGREKLASSIVDIILDYDFKGVDLDWEYPCMSDAGIAASPDDKPNFTELVKLLRQKLDDLEKQNGIHYLLTMAAGARENCAVNLEFDKMIDCMDFVYLMTYDCLPRGVTGHHTNLYFADEKGHKWCGADAIEIFIKYGVPVEKLVYGAAFYGRSFWDVKKGSGDGLFQEHNGNPPGFVSYSEILRRIQTTGKRHFDDNAKAPYVYDESDGFFASYDDEESLKYKTKYVNEKGLAGIMYWEYNCDKTGVLLKAMYDGMMEI